MSKLLVTTIVVLLSVIFNSSIAGIKSETDSTSNILKISSGKPNGYDTLPLKVGNKWFYQVYSHGHDDGTSVAEIIKDTVFEDGNTYYKFNFTSFLPQGSTEFLRCDSGQIYFLNYWDSTTTPVLKFTATPGESWEINFLPYFMVYFGTTDTLTIFNKLTRFFEYDLDGLQIARIQVSPDFGFLRIEDYGDTGSIIPDMSYTLKGCILSDTIYGDVSSVRSPSSRLNDFTLVQNYPNPFNGETIIKYYLPSGSNYSLILYEITGRKIRTIAEGYANSGMYSTSLDSHELSSGIYFVQLRAGNQMEYIKVVLLK